MEINAENQKDVRNLNVPEAFLNEFRQHQEMLINHFNSMIRGHLIGSKLINDDEYYQLSDDLTKINIHKKEQQG